jgi:hypothetical protein
MVPVVTVSARSSGVRLEDLVAVPVDVGKHSAMASVLDFTGAVLVKPFEFDLDRRGVEQLVCRVREAAPLSVSLVRVGLEAAGHYHLPLAGGAQPVEWELRLLNPGHVAMQRKANGQRGVKTDRVDLVAITDLLLAGRGTIAPGFADPVMTLAGWVAHRRRRSLVRRRTIQQLTTHVDRCFPGLGRVLWSVALSKSGRLILAELPDPARVARLGPTRLRSFAANRGVRMTRPLAERIVDAARQALPVPGADVARRLLAADLDLLDDIDVEIDIADAEITALLPSTPFAVLRTVPGWGRCGSLPMAPQSAIPNDGPHPARSIEPQGSHRGSTSPPVIATTGTSPARVRSRCASRWSISASASGTTTGARTRPTDHTRDVGRMTA